MQFLKIKIQENQWEKNSFHSNIDQSDLAQNIFKNKLSKRRSLNKQTDRWAVLLIRRLFSSRKEEKGDQSVSSVYIITTTTAAAAFLCRQSVSVLWMKESKEEAKEAVQRGRRRRRRCWYKGNRIVVQFSEKRVRERERERKRERIFSVYSCRSCTAMKTCAFERNVTCLHSVPEQKHQFFLSFEREKTTTANLRVNVRAKRREKTRKRERQRVECKSNEIQPTE